MMTDEEFASLEAAESKAWCEYKDASKPFELRWLELHRQKEKEARLRLAMKELSEQQKQVV